MNMEATVEKAFITINSSGRSMVWPASQGEMEGSQFRRMTPADAEKMMRKLEPIIARWERRENQIPRGSIWDRAERMSRRLRKAEKRATNEPPRCTCGQCPTQEAPAQVTTVLTSEPFDEAAELEKYRKWRDRAENAATPAERDRAWFVADAIHWSIEDHRRKLRREAAARVMNADWIRPILSDDR